VFSEQNKISVLVGGAKYLIDSVLSGGEHLINEIEKYRYEK
jgi:tRNA A37 N6-isopentenylltransferase MiaA